MKWSLKHLILLVALLAIGLTFLSTTTVGYRMNKETLIETTLETNRAYAEKLSSTTDTFLRTTLQTLEINAPEVIPYINEREALLKVADRVKTQTNTFNSMMVVGVDGTVLATSPQTLNIIGEKLTTVGPQEALTKQQPVISKPYIGITGRLIVLMSVPLFADDGTYLGFFGGTIYLNEPNILEEILGAHFYKDDSYVFVVDRDGHMLYHQQPQRVREDVSDNPVVQQLMEGKSGARQVTNTKGIQMLAGYAYVPIAKWGVVSQRPLDVSLAPAQSMVYEMILKTLPLLLVAVLIVWQLSRRIALPLQKLAYYAETSTDNYQSEKINAVPDWYYEAKQLKKALLHSLTFFKNEMNYFIHQSNTDPLTKLTNRRTMDERMKEWIDHKSPFAVVLLDIDKFKRVNDTYGHGVGDEVLIYLAELMKETARKGDICCRYGGEEFIILLPKADKVTAFLAAERLREKMESTVSPCGEVVTISAGVAAYPLHANHSAKLIELADQCLYEAKRTGRNKTIVYNSDTEPQYR